MAETRADRIYAILAKDGRSKVSKLREKLALLEESPDLHPSAISVAVRQDNTARAVRHARAFQCFQRRGRGLWVHFSDQRSKGCIERKAGANDPLAQIPLFIEKAAESVREKLRKDIAALTWQEFEANFLATVLDALGCLGYSHHAANSGWRC